MKQWEDPIVAEVREVRDSIAARHQYDIKALGHYYQQKQKDEQRRVVRGSPQYRNDQHGALG